MPRTSRRSQAEDISQTGKAAKVKADKKIDDIFKSRRPRRSTHEKVDASLCTEAPFLARGLFAGFIFIFYGPGLPHIDQEEICRMRSPTARNKLRVKPHQGETSQMLLPNPQVQNYVVSKSQSSLSSPHLQCICSNVAPLSHIASCNIYNTVSQNSCQILCSQIPKGSFHPDV